MAFGDSNSESSGTSARVEKGDDLAHLLYSNRHPQESGQITQAAQGQDDLPSLIYQKRPPMRDNGPPQGQSTDNGNGRTTFQPTGIYPGHGAPYTQYPPAPQTDVPRVPTPAPGLDTRAPGLDTRSPRVTTRVPDIGNRSSGDGFFSSLWGDALTLADYGVMIGAGRNAYKKQFGSDNVELDRFPKKVEDQLKGSMKEYTESGSRYQQMLERRYTAVAQSVIETAKENKFNLSQILTEPAKADAYAATLTAEQAGQFSVYRQFVKESKNVLDSILPYDTSTAHVDLKTPIVKPSIPVTADAPNTELGLGAKNPWAIRELSSQSILKTSFGTASENFAKDAAAAAKVDGKSSAALNSTNLWKLGVGYGSDFLLDRVAFRNSNPSLFTWGLDLAAAYTLKKPWGIGRTAMTMVGMHIGGRTLDSMFFSNK